MGTPTKDDLNNHGNQLNGNNEEYWKSRGLTKPSESSFMDDDEYRFRQTSLPLTKKEAEELKQREEDEQEYYPWGDSL